MRPLLSSPKPFLKTLSRFLLGLNLSKRLFIPFDKIII
nr:MAG TPA: hypothetical protein [Caudoviricetes sp.]